MNATPPIGSHDPHCYDDSAHAGPCAPLPAGMMTLGDLRSRTAAMHDSVWVILPDGPLRRVEPELGANEPFVRLLFGDLPERIHAVKACAQAVESEWVSRRFDAEDVQTETLTALLKAVSEL